MNQKDAAKAQGAPESQKPAGAGKPVPDDGVNRGHNTKKQALGPNTKR